jgi:hypothetical protein
MTVEAVAKVLGALTGVAVVVYGLGVLVLVRRLQEADLPWQDTIAALPRDQVLATGTVELGFSLLGAVLVLAVGNVLALSSWGHARRLLGAVVVFSLLSFLFVPFNFVGLACFVLLVGLTLWLYLMTARWWEREEPRLLLRDLLGSSQESAWSKRPMVGVSLLLAAIVVVVAVGRIWSFPANFDIATVSVDGTTSDRDALYIGSSTESVVLGSQESVGEVSLLQTSSGTRIDLRDNTEAEPYSRSLSSRLGLVPLTCFFPTCRDG